ncbi:hypothetical protein CHUAL_002810 [Chamberlinius hualienensis]
MKSVFALAAILFLIACNVVRSDRDDPPCDVDADCEWDECCALDFPGDRKVCRDIGDDIGDACGGPYFCGECRRNLICTPVSKPLPEPNGCWHPANGTCEFKRKDKRV